MNAQLALEFSHKIDSAYNYYNTIGATEEANKWVDQDLNLVPRLAAPSFGECVWAQFSIAIGWGAPRKSTYEKALEKLDLFLSEKRNTITDDKRKQTDFVKNVLLTIKNRRDPQLACLARINELFCLLNSCAQNERVVTHREVVEEVRGKYFTEDPVVLTGTLEKMRQCAYELRGSVPSISFVGLPNAVHGEIIQYLPPRDCIALQGTCKKMRVYKDNSLWQTSIANGFPRLLPFIQQERSLRETYLKHCRLVLGIKKAEPVLISDYRTYQSRQLLEVTADTIFLSISQTTYTFDRTTGKYIDLSNSSEVVHMIALPWTLFRTTKEFDYTLQAFRYTLEECQGKVMVPRLTITNSHALSCEDKVIYMDDGTHLRRWDIWTQKELDAIALPNQGKGTCRGYFFIEEGNNNDNSFCVHHLLNKETKILENLKGYTLQGAQGTLLYFYIPTLGAIKVYDFTTGKEVGTFFGCKGAAKKMDTDSGILFAHTENYVLIVWDQATGKILKYLEGVYSMAYLDGKLYYSIKDGIQVLDFLK